MSDTLLCLIVGRKGQINAPGERLSRFLKMEELFLGHSLIIIKWTWRFFPKICNMLPSTFRHKIILLVYPAAKFGKIYWHSGNSADWGIKPPSKTPPLSCQPPLKYANCPSPLYISFSWTPLPKSWIFQWKLEILKFFIVNPILCFKCNKIPS